MYSYFAAVRGVRGFTSVYEVWTVKNRMNGCAVGKNEIQSTDAGVDMNHVKLELGGDDGYRRGRLKHGCGWFSVWWEINVLNKGCGFN